MDDEPQSNLTARERALLAWDDHGLHAGIAPDDVVVERLDHFGWRVRDGRFPGDERTSIIGLIELVNEVFDAVRFGDFRKSTFTSLDEAVKHLTTVSVPAPEDEAIFGKSARG